MNSGQSTQAARETVAEFERAQARWLLIDTLLRRLASRLAHAAEGRGAELDATLGELRRQLRDPLDQPALDALLAGLTDAVRSLDAAAAGAALTPIPLAPVAAAAELLLQVVDRLQLDDAASHSLDGVRQAVRNATDDTALAAQAEALARLVNRHHRQLGEQRAAAERLLAHVTRQLDGLARYLDQDGIDHLGGSDSRHQLDQHVTGEIDALGDHLRQADAMTPLHRELESRLGAISSHLKTFREREEARERDWQSRSAQMSQRIGELEHSAQQMEASLRQEHQLASTDPLTGIANRAVFQQRLALACEQVAQGTAQACLLVLDIDHFKQVNDRFGHAAGDRALRIVAEQIKARLRSDDLLARYGGEEFVIVLAGSSAPAGHGVAEELRTCIEDIGFRGQDQPVRITLSGGVTALCAGDTPEQAFDRADRALYRAKHAGRNRCELA